MVRNPNPWLFAIFTGFFIVLIVWSIQIGTTDRPKVGYKLNECPKTYGLEYENRNIENYVELGVSNSGKTKSSLLLHFSGQNLTISNETKKPYNTINGSEVFFKFTASENNPQYYFGERVYFIVNTSVSGFSYNYNISKNDGASISGFISNFFGEITGYYPTKCSYKRDKNSKFVLVE